MKFEIFKLHRGEILLARVSPNRRWYFVAWRVISGLLMIALPVLAIYLFFSGALSSLLSGFLPDSTAIFITGLLLLGIVPLLVTAWVVEEQVRIFTGEYVLTDQRFWVRGSPYAWSWEEIPFDNIATMVYRRDALFLRRRSDKIMLVYMLPGGKAIVNAYTKHVS